MWEGGVVGNTSRNSASFLVTFQLWAIIEEIRIPYNINSNSLTTSLGLLNILDFIQCLKPHAGGPAEGELGRHIIVLICSGLLPAWSLCPHFPISASQTLLARDHDSGPSLTELHHQHPTPHPPWVLSSSHFPRGKHLMVCWWERESQFIVASLSI